jgi:hypothetical protein
MLENKTSQKEVSRLLLNNWSFFGLEHNLGKISQMQIENSKN